MAQKSDPSISTVQLIWWAATSAIGLVCFLLWVQIAALQTSVGELRRELATSTTLAAQLAERTTMMLQTTEYLRGELRRIYDRLMEPQGESQ